MLHSIGWCCFKRPVRRKTRFFASRKIMDVVQIVFSRFPIDNRIISHHPFKKKQHPNCIPKNIDIPHKKPWFRMFRFGRATSRRIMAPGGTQPRRMQALRFLGAPKWKAWGKQPFSGGKRIAQIIQYRKFKLVQALETL